MIKVGQKYRGAHTGTKYTIHAVDGNKVRFSCYGDIRSADTDHINKAIVCGTLILSEEKDDILNQPVSDRIVQKLREEGDKERAAASECDHEWIKYMGLNFSDEYEFCKKCEKEKK